MISDKYRIACHLGEPADLWGMVVKRGSSVFVLYEVYALHNTSVAEVFLNNTVSIREIQLRVQPLVFTCDNPGAKAL